ncbi:ferrioxamine receptor [Klebsiella pneumoniae]|uniref:Ferrioxamine receptor n=1 Tax=Klebsiella pneumoniae TaxID=573 RepID=A0A377U060_KLEPN|nr:ferrioxamine receptor [Klebsiella pneumoniae]
MRLMSDGGSHNVLQIDPWFIERVDVIRGPSSALYGQSVPGGVVNLTSKRPQFSQQGPHPPDRRHAKYQRRGLRLHRRHQ